MDPVRPSVGEINAMNILFESPFGPFDFMGLSENVGYIPNEIAI